jgi:DNA-binding NarL/FixJ family response regulator
MIPAGVEFRFNRLRVAVVENEAISLRGLTQTLDEIGCEVVWAAKDHEEARKLAETALPGIVFVDLKLLHASDDYRPGWQFIRELRVRDPQVAIIIFSGTPVVDDIVIESIRLGCSYIVKEDLWNQERDIIAGALLAAKSRSVMLSNEVVGSVEVAIGKAKDTSLLTDRELDVLELLADGLSNKEIAESLVIGETTVKSHVGNILSKLDVASRGKAAEWYRQHYG